MGNRTEFLPRENLFLLEYSILKIFKFLETFGQNDRKKLLTSFLKLSFTHRELETKIRNLGNFITRKLFLLYDLDPNIIMQFINILDNFNQEALNIEFRKKTRLLFNREINRWNRNQTNFRKLNNLITTIKIKLGNIINLPTLEENIVDISIDNVEDYVPNQLNHLILECEKPKSMNSLNVSIPVNWF